MQEKGNVSDQLLEWRTVAFFLLHTSQVLHFTLPAPEHFYVLVTSKPKRKCDVFPDEDI